jgi:hypothetical protein
MFPMLIDTQNKLIDMQFSFLFFINWLDARKAVQNG